MSEFAKTDKQIEAGMSLENVCPFCAKTWDNFHQCAPTKTPLSLDEFDEKDEGAFRYWADCNSEPSKQLNELESFIEGRRWQHSKDKAVIQELRAELTKAQMEIAFLKDPYNFPQFLRDFQSLSDENKEKINQLAEALMACKK